MLGKCRTLEVTQAESRALLMKELVSCRNRAHVPRKHQMDCQHVAQGLHNFYKGTE